MNPLLNNTAVAAMSNKDIISKAHTLTAIPSMIILFISMIFIFIVVGMISIEGKKSRLKYIGILALGISISCLILLALVFMPNVVNSISQSLINLFN